MITGRPNGPLFFSSQAQTFPICIFPNQKSRKQWEFSFKCCNHPKREWKGLEQHRCRAENTDDCTIIQEWIRNRTGWQIWETFPQTAGNSCPGFQHKVQEFKLAVTWLLTPALYSSQTPSRYGSYMPGHVSSASISYSSLWLSSFQCVLLPHPSGDSWLYHTYTLKLDRFLHPRAWWDSKQSLLSIVVISY